MHCHDLKFKCDVSPTYDNSRQIDLMSIITYLLLVEFSNSAHTSL